MKLGKNASDTCAVSLRLMRRSCEKSLVHLSGINGSKRVTRIWKMMMTSLITFFSIKGIADFELIPQGQTVNQGYCMEVVM
jgi:hypothetical protein